MQAKLGRRLEAARALAEAEAEAAVQVQQPTRDVTYNNTRQENVFEGAPPEPRPRTAAAALMQRAVGRRLMAAAGQAV
jgi:hypothetical protein